MLTSALDFFGDSQHTSCGSSDTSTVRLGKHKRREAESDSEHSSNDDESLSGNTKDDDAGQHEEEGERENAGVAMTLFTGHTPASLMSERTPPAKKKRKKTSKETKELLRRQRV